jgi:transcriptional regulator with XRE-family HTH domain
MTYAGTSLRTEINVGQCLRELRAQRGLSIRALAEKSGLAVNTLSLIEHGKTSPSCSTLQQLASALEMPITAFFETSISKCSVSYIRAGQRPRAAFTHGALEDLGAGLTDRVVEPFVITLEPSAGSGTRPIVHTGYEFIFCLKGRIVYTIEEQSYVLEPGDSLLFESHLPHCWQNVAAQPSEAILVLCPSDKYERSIRRHMQVIGQLP